MAKPGPFYAAAAESIRRILLDHAKAHRATKRGGAAKKGVLSVTSLVDLTSPEKSEEILALEEAVCRLEAENAEAGKIVRLRFYAGLTVDQTAAAMDLPPRTVDRRWSFARAWLRQQLSEYLLHALYFQIQRAIATAARLLMPEYAALPGKVKWRRAVANVIDEYLQLAAENELSSEEFSRMNRATESLTAWDVAHSERFQRLRTLRDAGFVRSDKSYEDEGLAADQKGMQGRWTATDDGLSLELTIDGDRGLVEGRGPKATLFWNAVPALC